MRIIVARKNYLTNCRSIAILDTVMNYYWITANLIKEYARGYRQGNQSLDDFFAELRQVVDSELETTSLEERMKEYDQWDNWNDDAGA